MLKPMFGAAALFVFALGILAAGISSHLPNLMVMPWLADDTRGRERNTRSRAKLLVLAGLSLVSVLGVFMERPVFLLLLSQAGISVVLPMALLGLISVSAREEFFSKLQLRMVDCIVLALISLFALVMSYQGVRGLIDDLTG